MVVCNLLSFLSPFQMYLGVLSPFVHGNLSHSFQLLRGISTPSQQTERQTDCRGREEVEIDVYTHLLWIYLPTAVF